MLKNQISMLHFFVDISGVPKREKGGDFQKVIVSCVSFNVFTLEKTIEAFREKFPTYWDQKGHQLTKYQLEEIVSFLDQQEVRMITVHFDPEDWIKYKGEYPNESHREEKIMGILYFYAMKWIARKGYIYPVIVDNDTTFSIKQAIVICQRLARSQNLDFNVSFGYIETHPELRFADWVASARRKIDPSILNNYHHFMILRNKLPPMYLFNVFKKVRLNP